MRGGLLAAVLLVGLAGCAGVDYEAQGDRYVAQGDYAAAYDAYRQVPADAGSPELPRKTERALEQAVEAFVDDAQRALDDQRYEEALRIARNGQKYSKDERLRTIERQARERTVSNAVEVGRLHLQQGRYADAIEQFETALRYDSSAETTALLLQAKRGRADELEAQARQLAASGEFDAAIAAANKALLFEDVPERRATLAAIQRDRDAWVEARFNDAVAQGRSLLEGADWANASAAFQTALGLRRGEPAESLLRYADAMLAGDVALQRQDARSAIASFRTAIETGHDVGEAQRRLDGIEADRQAKIAQAYRAIEAGDWTTAQGALRAVRDMADDAEVAAWLRYATAMLEGENAVAAGAYPAAEAAFQRALSVGRDDGGRAATRLAAVRPATWRITLVSVTVLPFKADDSVWDSMLTKALPLDRIMAGYRAGAAGKDAAEAAGNLVPEKNLPDPFVRFTLPDGSSYETKAARGVLYAPVGATFSIQANAYDQREIAFEVFDDDRAGVDEGPRGPRGPRHGGGRGEVPAELVGAVRLKVSDLLGQGLESRHTFGQVYELAVRLENRGSEAAGPVMGATALTPPAAEPTAGGGDDGDESENHAPGRSPQREGCTRWRIRLVEAFVSNADTDDEGGEGDPDPRVEIRQGDQVVFQHTLDANGGGRTWEEPREQPRTVLWVAPDDQIVVRLLDVDPDGDDEVLSYRLGVSDLEGGTIRLDKGNGSRVVFTATKG